jgi:hypothetical protein
MAVMLLFLSASSNDMAVMLLFLSASSNDMAVKIVSPWEFGLLRSRVWALTLDNRSDETPLGNGI